MLDRSFRTIKMSDKFSRYERSLIKNEVVGHKCGFFTKRNFSVTFKFIDGIYHVTLTEKGGQERKGKFVFIKDTRK